MNDFDGALQLLEAGANAKESDIYGRSALLLAVMKRSVPLVDQLLKMGATLDTEGSTAFAAARGGNTQIALMIRKAGGADFVMLRASLDHLDVLNALLDAGANPNAVGDVGITALMDAAQENKSAAAQVLLDRGANVNARVFDDAQTGQGDTPLARAAYHGHVDVLRVLLRAKAEVNLRAGVSRATALAWAAWGRQSGTMKELLQAGANVNWAVAGGDTPLILVTRAGRADLVQLLLDSRADVNLPGFDGTALQIAIRDGNQEIVALLRNAGANQ